jgi:hypothetical protein
VTASDPPAIVGGLLSGGSLRFSPALAGGRYFAGSAAIARCIARAAAPCHVTARLALLLLPPSSAAVNVNAFAPGCSFARMLNDPSRRGLTAVRVPSGLSMYTVAPAGLTAPLKVGWPEVVA